MSLGEKIIKAKVEASFRRQEILEQTEENNKSVNRLKKLYKDYNKDKQFDKANKIKTNIEEYRAKNKELRHELKTLDKEWGVSIQHLTDYEEDAMWMSYRYAIGRHTIASHYHTLGLFENCYGRLSKERTEFIAFDMNREIENILSYGSNPSFHFHIYGYNKIYKTAIDTYCEFIESEGITTREELQSYERVNVELDRYENEDHSIGERIVVTPKKREGEYENDEHYSMMHFEDLFVWNDLVHIFNLSSHKRARLKDGTIVEYFWSWIPVYRQLKDGSRQEIAYKKVRRSLYDWNPVTTVWLPDESIEEELD